jgi:hypothetical protein
VHLPLPCSDVDRNEVRLGKFPAVDGDCIDLVDRIGARDVAVRCVPRATHADADHAQIAIQGAPLALHPHDTIAQIEEQVVATMFCDGLEDVNPELDRLQRYRGLGDVALVVGGEHLPILARQMSHGDRAR